MAPCHFLRQPGEGFIHGQHLLAVLVVRQTRPEAFMFGHRTLNHRRRVIREANSDSTTSSGVRPNGSIVYTVPTTAISSGSLCLLLRIITLDRGFRGGSSHGNALAIGTHHAQGAFLLGAAAGAPHETDALSQPSSGSSAPAYRPRDARPGYGPASRHPTIGGLNRETLRPILQQVRKVALRQLELGIKRHVLDLLPLADMPGSDASGPLS